MNTLTGFASDKSHAPYDWQLLLTVSTIAIAGLFIGTALNKQLSPGHLKKVFGYFVILVGLYVITRELLSNHLI
jgi:uncharacterized membrane protein YfcA